MAREGKKLELYEILAAKRAKGKAPLGLDSNAARPANMLESETPPQQLAENEVVKESPRATAIIIDDSIDPGTAAAYTRELEEPEEPEPAFFRPKEAPPSRTKERKTPAKEIREAPEPSPAPEPRPRSSREVVFSLETALIFFSAVIVLVASAFFLGYKRGQEEKPVGTAGPGLFDPMDPGNISIPHLSSAPRATLRPPEDGYTLLLRAEPAGEDLPERLEMELAEAVALGGRQAGFDVQGFIFRSEGASPQHYLTVGLGQTANDNELNKLWQIYNRMDGLTVSRVPTPYLGCRIAPVRELGVSVY